MMLLAAFIVGAAVLLVVAWYDDFCPQCHRHALVPADVGDRCQRCGWFER